MIRRATRIEPVARYINRPLSRPLGRLVARTPVTPNAVTLFTVLLAVVAGSVTAAGWFIAGGVLIQAVNILDGVDGEVARRRGQSSRLGGFLDSVTDRYADAVMLAGMAVFAIRHEDQWHPELAGALALAGSLVVSYSRERIQASMGEGGGGEGTAAKDSPDGRGDQRIDGLASRDVRLLVMAVGTVVGQCYWTLWAVAGVTAATVAWSLLYLRIRTRAPRGRGDR